MPKLANKVKMFVWRLAHNNLPVRCNIASRGIKIDTVCPLCIPVDEGLWRWWRLEKEEGLWQDIIIFKYIKKGSINSVKHIFDNSPIWADLLKVKTIYMQGIE